MAKLRLSMLLPYKDVTLPLLDGRVVPEGIDPVIVVERGHGRGTEWLARTLKRLEFDICEVSISSYIMAKARDVPLIGIPVFVHRLFSQSQMYVNTSAGIGNPQDLVGTRVGLISYQTSLSVLAKGDLLHEYGLPLEKVTWVTSTEEPIPFDPPEGVRIERIAEGKDIDAMLVAGEIQALMTPGTPPSILQGDPRVARLFSDPKAEERAYFQRNGFYPIMHVIALKEKVYRENPWVAGNMLDGFERAKGLAYESIRASQLAWARLLYEEERQAFGQDLWPHGVSRNRKNLERFIQYSYDQGLIPQKLKVEELFAETTWET